MQADKKFHLRLNVLVMLVLSSFASTAHAALPNAADMLANFAQQIPALMNLVTAIGFILGTVCIITGISKLKTVGESRTMMSQEKSLLQPIAYIFVGTALIYLPSSVWVGLDTFWQNPTPYAYITQTTDQWSEAIKNCFMIIQLVGTIAFIRGLVLLTHVGGQQSQQGTFARGITHIIGGILCINIYQFVQVIAATFGISVPL